MSRTLFIIGAGGHGRVAADIAVELGWDTIGFLDDSEGTRTQIGPWPILGASSSLANRIKPGDAIFIAIGQNASRQRVTGLTGNTLGKPVTLIHPAAVVSRFAVVGSGVLIAPGAVVGPFASIGAGSIINTGCTVDHDCQIAEFVHISPGANVAGAVRIGARSWIGVGTCVREGISIGSDVMIAAGAAVVSDVADGERVGGVPAKRF